MYVQCLILAFVQNVCLFHDDLIKKKKKFPQGESSLPGNKSLFCVTNESLNHLMNRFVKTQSRLKDKHSESIIAISLLQQQQQQIINKIISYKK